MSVNNWMAQDLADILNLEVERPDFVETTALGAAMCASVGAGLYEKLDDAARAMRGSIQSFSSAMTEDVRAARLARYVQALKAA